MLKQAATQAAFLHPVPAGKTEKYVFTIEGGYMAKKAAQKKKAAEQIKIDLKFELLGIILLTLGIFTLYHIGKTGTTLILFFRFFFGRLYWVAVASLVVLSVFLMIKRAWPAFFTVRMTGFYLLFASALLYCHERLIGSLANAHELSGNSAVENTIRIWHQEEQIWWKLVLGGDVHGNIFSTQIGGGMAGAILYAASHFLFDSAGTKIICVLLALIALMLLTGKPVSPYVEKALEGLWLFLKKQWNQMKTEFQAWREAKKRKTGKETAESAVAAAIRLRRRGSQRRGCRTGRRGNASPDYFQLYGAVCRHGSASGRSAAGNAGYRSGRGPYASDPVYGI